MVKIPRELLQLAGSVIAKMLLHPNPLEIVGKGLDYDLNGGEAAVFGCVVGTKVGSVTHYVGRK